MSSITGDNTHAFKLHLSYDFNTGDCNLDFLFVFKIETMIYMARAPNFAYFSIAKAKRMRIFRIFFFCEAKRKRKLIWLNLFCTNSHFAKAKTKKSQLLSEFAFASHKWHLQFLKSYEAAAGRRAKVIQIALSACSLMPVFSPVLCSKFLSIPPRFRSTQISLGP